MKQSVILSHFWTFLPKGFICDWNINLSSVNEKVISLMYTTSNRYDVNAMEITVVRITTLDSGLPVDVMYEPYCLYKTIWLPVFQHDYCQQSSTRGWDNEGRNVVSQRINNAVCYRTCSRHIYFLYERLWTDPAFCNDTRYFLFMIAKCHQTIVIVFLISTCCFYCKIMMLRIGILRKKYMKKSQDLLYI